MIINLKKKVSNKESGFGFCRGDDGWYPNVIKSWSWW